MTRPKANARGNVYFLRRADNVGPIKIGCSAAPLSRLDQIQAWSPEPLTIIASAPATFRTEERLHRQFDEIRLHGEWFEAAPVLLSLVNKVAATGKIPPAPADDKWQRMSAMYRGGQTLKEIGEEFGVSRERVRQILRKAGVPSEGHRAHHKRTSVASANEARIGQMVEDGCTVPEMAEAVGDCLTNVRAVLRRNGWKASRAKRQPREKTVILAHAVAADYHAGLIGAEIAAKHGIAQPHIYRLLRIAGTKPRRNGKHASIDRADMVAFYKTGATIVDCAEKFGCAVATARSHLDRAGVLRGRAENEAIRIERVKAGNVKRWAA